jgi:hypothetical protein
MPILAGFSYENPWVLNADVLIVFQKGDIFCAWVHMRCPAPSLLDFSPAPGPLRCFLRRLGVVAWVTEEPLVTLLIRSPSPERHLVVYLSAKADAPLLLACLAQSGVAPPDAVTVLHAGAAPLALDRTWSTLEHLYPRGRRSQPWLKSL